MKQKPLQAQGVLVTRPAHQAGPFIQLLQAEGAHAIAFPSIEIQSITQSLALDQLLITLETQHIAIFISANAAYNAVKWLEINKITSKNYKVAAIGWGTMKALKSLNMTVDYCADHTFTSESLLELDIFQTSQIQNKHIIIFKGRGGRELLQKALIERGAHVSLAEVYQRRVPEADINPLLKLWQDDQIHWITVTSNESLKNLYYMFNSQQRHWLCQTPLIVPGERVSLLAEQLGFKHILQADSALDEAILDCIKQNAHKFLNRTI